MAVMDEAVKRFDFIDIQHFCGLCWCACGSWLVGKDFPYDRLSP